MTGIRCGNENCGRRLDEPPGLPLAERTPCPQCGSLARNIEGAAHLSARGTLSAEGTVERVLSGTRLAVLGILVTIGLTVGFGVRAAWWVGVPSGVCAFVAASALIAWPRSRHLMMAFVHRITNR